MGETASDPRDGCLSMAWLLALFVIVTVSSFYVNIWFIQWADGVQL